MTRLRKIRHSAWSAALVVFVFFASIPTAIPSSASPPKPTVQGSGRTVASAVFVDVPPGRAFYNEITWMYQRGISTGWVIGGQRYYKPLEAVSREAMAAFMYRMAGKPSTPPALATSPFADVPTTHPFYREISWMYQRGISTGWGVGGKRYYKPGESVARDAMAAFMYRYAGGAGAKFSPPARSPFTDVTPASPFYREITWMFWWGITTGWGYANKIEFRSAQPVSREAMAAFMYRLSRIGSAPPPAPTVDLYDCSSFSTWTEAQRIHLMYLPYYGDVFGLDADHDYSACESLKG